MKIKTIITEMSLFLIWGLLALFAIFGGSYWLLSTL
jgi:hypothetical protein